LFFFFKNTFAMRCISSILFYELFAWQFASDRVAASLQRLHVADGEPEVCLAAPQQVGRP